MTIDDIIHYRAQQIIMAADYTTFPPRSPQLKLLRDRYPLKLSVNELDALLWREAERVADDVIFNNFREN
jgi:hypothetical protein